MNRVILLVLVILLLLLLLSSEKSNYVTPEKKKIIVFWTSAKTDPEWNGENMRSGGIGQSGSVLTLVTAAEYLASVGHDVIFSCNNIKEGTYLGVNYTKKTDLTTKYDVIIANTIFFNDIPKDIKADKLLLNFPVVELNLTNNFKNELKNVKEIINVHPSQWTLDANKQKYGKDGVVINNPLMMDCLIDIELDKQRPLNIVWHAAYERGGDVAKRVADKVGAEFTKMDYNTKEFSADKNTIMKNLKNSSYFIYPLVLPDGRLHKDTFACCVAEALAMGVIVITWSVACLPEVYKDSGIVFAIPPSGTNIENLTSSDYSSEPKLLTEEAVDSLCYEITRIEKDPELKRSLRIQGSEFARNKFNCANKWGELL